MNIRLPFSLALIILWTGCSEHVHDENCQSNEGYHVHSPLMGGELIAVGEHGSGYNLEIIIDELDRLSIYILDAHAEGFVRISQPTLVVLINENNQSMVLKLDAVADSATGETVGDTSHFRSSNSIQATTPFEGNIKSLAIGSRKYNQTKISYPGTKEQ